MGDAAGSGAVLVVDEPAVCRVVDDVIVGVRRVGAHMEHAGADGLIGSHGGANEVEHDFVDAVGEIGDEAGFAGQCLKVEVVRTAAAGQSIRSRTHAYPIAGLASNHAIVPAPAVNRGGNGTAPAV